MLIFKRTWRRGRETHLSATCLFSEMLQQIGVPKEIAQEDACRIEHVISEETFEAIQKYYEEHEAR